MLAGYWAAGSVRSSLRLTPLILRQDVKIDVPEAFSAGGSIPFPFNLDFQSPKLKRTRILRPPDVPISEQCSLQVGFSTVFVIQRSSSSLRVMRIIFQYSLNPNLFDGKETNREIEDRRPCPSLVAIHKCLLLSSIALTAGRQQGLRQ